MDNFIVSARKYRPDSFDKVIGQASIAATLKRAIVSGKLANAYLFCGPRGVGKTTCARIFAKSINCLNPHEDGEACNECESCASFNNQMSINIQELNAAANNSVEDIRNIIDQVRIPPQLGKYKVIILDEVHMLSQAAGNALLKTLEEPPSYVIFILATTEKHKIMPTILSRCQIFDFNRMEVDDIIKNLKMVAQNENIQAEDEALNVIAQKADGGMRDSLSIFDQVANFSAGNVTYQNVIKCLNVLDYEYYFKMTDLLTDHKVKESMLLFNEICNKGFNGGVFIGGLAQHVRDVLMSKDEATIELLDTSKELKKRYAEQAKKCSVKFLYYAIQRLDKCSNEYKASYNKRLSIEIALIETAQFGEDSVGVGLSPTKTLKPIFQKQQAHREIVSDDVTVNKTENIESANHQIKLETQSNSQVPIAEPQKKQTLILRSTPSIKINHKSKNDNTSQEQEENHNITNKENNPYNETQLDYFWNAYADNLPPQEAAMKGRMKSMHIYINAEGNIEVLVVNEIIENELKSYIPDIENFLCEKIGNNNIKINIVVAKTEEQKMIYDPKVLFNKMLEKNSNLSILHNDLGLEIIQ